MKKINQSGFGALEMILVVVIIAAVAAVGAFVVHTKNKTNDVLNTSSTSPAKTSSIYQIKDLGVQLRLPNSIGKLSSTTSDVSSVKGAKATVTLNDDGLTSLAKQCATAGKYTYKGTPSLGALTKFDGTYSASSADGAPQLLKQFSGFYVTVEYPNGGEAQCGASSKTLNAEFTNRQAQDQKAFVTAFKANAVAIK